MRYLENTSLGGDTTGEHDTINTKFMTVSTFDTEQRERGPGRADGGF